MSALLLGAWSRILPYLVIAGVVVLAIGLLVSKLIGAGRAAERAEAGMKALQRTREANDARARASQPITPAEEANDPYNRDRR